MRKATIIKAAGSAGLLAAVAAAAMHLEAQVNVSKPSYPYEKVYGVSKAGENDCFGVGNSCGHTSKKDRDPEAWIYLPKGSAEKIAGARLSPP